jgi:hypothetical protein
MGKHLRNGGLENGKSIDARWGRWEYSTRDFEIVRDSLSNWYRVVLLTSARWTAATTLFPRVVDQKSYLNIFQTAYGWRAEEHTELSVAALAAMLPDVAKAIFSILDGKKKLQKQEIDAAKKKLIELVKTAQAISQALGHYQAVEENAVRVLVHARELKELMIPAQTPTLVDSLRRLAGGAVDKLEDSLLGIQTDSVVYLKTTRDVGQVRDHLKDVMSNLDNNKKNEAQKELGYAIDKLDEIVASLSNEIDKLLKPLSEAYSALTPTLTPPQGKVLAKTSNLRAKRK